MGLFSCHVTSGPKLNGHTAEMDGSSMLRVLLLLALVGSNRGCAAVESHSTKDTESCSMYNSSCYDDQVAMATMQIDASTERHHGIMLQYYSQTNYTVTEETMTREQLIAVCITVPVLTAMVFGFMVWRHMFSSFNLVFLLFVEKVKYRHIDDAILPEVYRHVAVIDTKKEGHDAQFARHRRTTTLKRALSRTRSLKRVVSRSVRRHSSRLRRSGEDTISILSVPMDGKENDEESVTGSNSDEEQHLQEQEEVDAASSQPLHVPLDPEDLPLPDSDPESSSFESEQSSPARQISEIEEEVPDDECDEESPMEVENAYLDSTCM